MSTNYVAVEFKPLFTPFDYSFPPCREYIPLQEIEYFAPRPRKVLPVYREVMTLQESDANEFIAMLREEGEDTVIKCLTDYYDYGTGIKHKIQPWSEQDQVYRSGPYTLIVNFYIPSISLYGIE